MPGSGTLIKKIDDETYMLLTSARTFEAVNGEDQLEISGNP